MTRLLLILLALAMMLASFAACATEDDEYVPTEESMAEYDRAVEAFYANKK